MGGFVESIVGDATDFVDDVVGTVGDVIDSAVGAVEDLGKSIDGFVNDNIPGGWATLAIAAGAYFGPELLATEGGAGGAGGVVNLGTATGADLSTAYDVGAGTTAGTAGVETGSLASAAVVPAAVDTTLATATEGAGASAAGGQGLTMANTVAPNLETMSGAQGLQASTSANLAGPSLTSPSSWVGPTGMGGAQGLTMGEVGGTGTLGSSGISAATVAGAAPTTSGVTQYFATKGAMDTLTSAAKPAISGFGNTAATLALAGLLTSRRSESMARRDANAQQLSKGGAVVRMADGGVIPSEPDATLGNPVLTTVTKEMQAAAPTAATAATAATPTPVTAATVTAPTAVAAPSITAATSQTAIEQQLANTKAVQGALSQQDLATAATQVPTTTALSGIQAAQGEAAQVAPIATRTLQAGETVSGTAVEQPKVEAALAQNVAAQGTVTEDMTTQGQLNKLLSSFDAGNPPPWAAGSMRAATAQLAARGLATSSLAGQAVIQAALEAATPLAAADAKVYEQMGLTNLSNRQAMALTTAQQRAAFLGQEFDQNFQSKVMNAAKVSDIANKNFDATVQIGLENAQLANTMNLANLSSKQAIVMANAAQIANLETTNLNNRQQVAVENSKAFLAMDMKNVDLQQQTSLFKAQDISNAILSDTAAQNAAKATNAANALDASKVNAQLALTADQYNTAERNKVALTNMATSADLLKFNAAEANDRADFNANLTAQINLANAKIISDVSTANTREVNAMTAVNAKNATDLSASAYAQLSQTYRDQLEMAWKTSDNDAQRATQITTTTITANATKYSAEQNADAQFYAAIGNAVAKVGTSGGGETLIDWITKKVIG